jgi:hypothetical protein
MKKTSHRRRDLREKKLAQIKRAAIVPDAERQRFLAGVTTDFAALRNTPDAWREEQAERAAWDCTLADGLKDK